MMYTFLRFDEIQEKFMTSSMTRRHDSQIVGSILAEIIFLNPTKLTMQTPILQSKTLTIHENFNFGMTTFRIYCVSWRTIEEIMKF